MQADSGSRDCLMPETLNKSEAGSDHVPPCPEYWENAYLKSGKETPKKKLCGYLHKFSAKAPIKTWKSRWFFYDGNKGHLLYYRTAQDVNPLGSIDISSASFDLKVGSDEDVFEIKTPSKDFILKAVNKQATMYWLQQLQIKRWEFCTNQAQACVADEAVLPCSVNAVQLNDTDAEHEFLPSVKTPTEDVVGIKAAFLPPPQPSIALQNISLKHPWIEIQ